MCSTNPWYYKLGRYGTLDEQIAQHVKFFALQVNNQQLQTNYEFVKRNMHHSTYIRQKLTEAYFSEICRRRLGI